MRPGNLSGVGHPVGRMRRLLAATREGASLATVLDRAEAVDSLARLLTEAFEKNQTKDGRVDMRDVAAHVLAKLQGSPR